MMLTYRHLFYVNKVTRLAQDNPDLFAVMEKTRLVIFHGTESEVCMCAQYSSCFSLCHVIYFHVHDFAVLLAVDVACYCIY